MLHFPVECKIWSPVVPTVKKNLSLQKVFGVIVGTAWWPFHLVLAVVL